MSRAPRFLLAFSFLGLGCADASPEATTQSAALLSASRPSTTIAAGWAHSCALHEGGEVWCWGYNGNGRLGIGQATPLSEPPTRVVGLAPAVAVTAGATHSCAIVADGSAWCWGNNSSGQLGDGTRLESAVPVPVYGLTSVTSISAGDYHTCAARSDGATYCWGDNASHQLGNKSSAADSPTPVAVKRASGALVQIEKVEAGSYHTCALRWDGDVFCWGSNGSGELGDGTTGAPDYAVNVITLNKVVDVAAGASFSCAVRYNGKVKCWGANRYGRLGDGSNVLYSTALVTVASLDDAAAITLGETHACALRDDGTGACWGGMSGERLLGNPNIQSSSVPVQVVGADDLTEISALAWHTLALRADGTLYGWGENLSSKIGGPGAYLDPVQVPFTPGRAPAIAAGDAHTCALADDGTVRCFGANTHGQLGDGSVNSSDTPVTVTGLDHASVLAAGTGHTCAVRADGTVWCWGQNDYGQLGDVSWNERRSPVKVYGIDGAIDVCTGESHSCAVLTGGSVRCWGRTDLGQTGDGLGGGAGRQPTNVPVEVMALATAVEVACGKQHTCARAADGTLYCWGLGSSGQRGTGTFGSSSGPSQVPGITNATGLTAGGYHTCAVLADGKASCWGANDQGQLGNQSTANQSSPVSVLGVSDAVAIEAGSSHTCAVLADGASWCWGGNASGQLGDGTLQQRTSAVANGLAGAFAITAGGAHSCAALADGSMLCWGINTSGQLGDGTTHIRKVPTQVVPF